MVAVVVICSGHPWKYLVFLDRWNEHGELYVPDLSQTVPGTVRQRYGKVRVWPEKCLIHVNQWLKRLKLLSQLILNFSFTGVSRLAEVIVSNLNSGIVKIKSLLTIIVHCQVEARESKNHQREGIVTAKSSKLTLHWEYDNQIKVWTVQLRDGGRQELEYELDF